MSDDNHAHPQRFFKLDNEVIEGCRNDRVKASGWFIHKGEFWVKCDSAGDGRTFQHTAGKFRRQKMVLAQKVNEVELHAGDDLDKFFVKICMFTQRQSNIFSNGHRRHERTTLERNTNTFEQIHTLVRGGLIKRLAEEFNITHHRLFKADQMFQEG